MKSFILFASAATLARAGLLNANADAGLLNANADAGLGLHKDGSADAHAHLGLGLNLPKGIIPDKQHLPHGPPDAAHTDKWHPPHPGVIIDGCDDDGDEEWHYVHPCKDCSTSSVPPHVWTTSTVPAYPTPTVVKCTDCASGQEVVTVTVPPSTTVVPVPATAFPTVSMTSSVPTSVDDPADPADPTSSSASLAYESIIPTTSTEAPVVTATSIAATSAPSQGFSTYTVPAAQPSGGVPIYKIPSNQTTPVYSPPAPPAPPTGCAGEGCRPVYSPPAVVVQNPGQPAGTGSPSTPTVAVVVAGASRQSVGALLFAGAVAALLL